ncbi:MAG: hypothetical protein QXU32_01885 [Nitrososphaerales archaeon]
MGVVTCFLPSDDGAQTAQHYYIVDSEPELPIDNVQGDLAYTKDTTKLWKATGAGAWFEIGGAASEIFIAENKDTVTIKAGQVVTVHSSGDGVILASATSKLTYAVGLALVDIDVGMVGVIATDGPFTLSDWTNTTGTALLIPKSKYYLDTIPGRLTTVPPSGTNNISQEIGKALSTTKLEISIEEFIIIAV